MSDNQPDPQDQVTIDIIKAIDSAGIVRLYRDAGWWKEEYSPAFIPALISNSFCFVVARHGGEVVGMGRAISDGVSDAYIQDVVVLKKYRGQGIGKKIILAIVAFLKKEEIDWIGLIGAPGTGRFYEQAGFRVMKDFVPMRLQD
jgi:spermidine synthase